MTLQQPTFIDLFSGIGGFRLAFERAGFQCLLSSEINDVCRQTYQANFNECPLGDITQIPLDSIPHHDVLTAGFPCQPFSICGKKRGFEDTRGTLFFHICEIIAAKKPKVVLLENVKHLIHHDNGNTLSVILNTLEELGYLVNFALLNAKDFGVAQNRERIIIFATQKKRFNFKQCKTVTTTDTLINYLDSEGDFEFLTKDEYTLIDNPILQKQSGLIFVGYRNKAIWKTGIRPNTEHLSRVHRQPNRIYSVLGTHPTLPSQESSGRFFIYLPDKDAVRKLTIKECYRLMGFPEDFKITPIKSEAYKQIGNSVCIPMITELAQQIRKQNLLSYHESQPVIERNIQLSLDFSL
ncbi:MAG: DNA (cytosine-5-)-methyltransferase [Methylococcaceae bacterium]